MVQRMPCRSRACVVSSVPRAGHVLFLLCWPILFSLRIVCPLGAGAPSFEMRILNVCIKSGFRHIVLHLPRDLA